LRDTVEGPTCDSKPFKLEKCHVFTYCKHSEKKPQKSSRARVVMILMIHVMLWFFHLNNCFYNRPGAPFTRALSLLGSFVPGSYFASRDNVRRPFLFNENALSLTLSLSVHLLSRARYTTKILLLLLLKSSLFSTLYFFVSSPSLSSSFSRCRSRSRFLLLATSNGGTNFSPRPNGKTRSTNGK
jgi:hypothetical protein